MRCDALSHFAVKALLDSRAVARIGSRCAIDAGGGRAEGLGHRALLPSIGSQGSGGARRAWAVHLGGQREPRFLVGTRNRQKRFPRGSGETQRCTFGPRWVGPLEVVFFPISGLSGKPRLLMLLAGLAGLCVAGSFPPRHGRSCRRGGGQRAGWVGSVSVRCREGSGDEAVPVPVNFGRGGPGQPRPTFTVLSVPPFQMEGGLVIPVNSGLGRPGRRRSEFSGTGTALDPQRCLGNSNC